MFPEGWVGLEGNKLHELITNLVKEILVHNKELSRYTLCKTIAEENKICVNMVWNYLKKSYIVIPILNSLIKIWGKEFKKGESEIEQLKKQIVISTETLKVNNSSCQKMLAVKELNEYSAFLVGAHAADGMINMHISFSGEHKEDVEDIKTKLEEYLGKKYMNSIYLDKYKKTYQFGISVDDSLNRRVIDFIQDVDEIKKRSIRVKRDYKWKIIDYYQLPLEKIKNDLNTLFGLRLNLKREKSTNAYILETKNKLLVRYLHIFFDCPYGKKSRIIDEPQIIKQSTEKNRLAFARGVLTFDGGVSRDKTVKLQLYSPALIFSVMEILTLHAISFTHCKTKRGSYQIQSSGDIRAWLNAIEEKTEKWNKLKSLIEGCSKTGTKNEAEFIKHLSEIYPKSGTAKIDITKLLTSSKALKNFDVKKLSNYLNTMYKTKAGAHTVLKNLEILTKSEVLTQTKEKQFFTRLNGDKKGTKGAVMKNVFVFNPNYKEWKLPY